MEGRTGIDWALTEKPARIIQQHCILQKKHTVRKPAKEAPDAW